MRLDVYEVRRFCFNFRGSLLVNIWFGIFDLKNFDGINLFCFKLLDLWYFFVVFIGN